MTNFVNLKQEAGRKRLAKLLGIAPFRIDLTLSPEVTGGVLIEIDGAPASPEQAKTFWDDVASVVTTTKPPSN